MKNRDEAKKKGRRWKKWRLQRKKKYSKNKNYNAFRELTEDSISMK